MSGDDLLMLRMAADECRFLDYRLSTARTSRDRLALEAIGRGRTWRDVAAAAGFANPYIRHLKAAAAGQGKKTR